MEPSGTVGNPADLLLSLTSSALWQASRDNSIKGGSEIDESRKTKINKQRWGWLSRNVETHWDYTCVLFIGEARGETNTKHQTHFKQSSHHLRHHSRTSWTNRDLRSAHTQRDWKAVKKPRPPGMFWTAAWRLTGKLNLRRRISGRRPARPVGGGTVLLLDTCTWIRCGSRPQIPRIFCLRTKSVHPDGKVLA